MAADYETAVYSNYRYPPSLAAAIVAIIFFLLTASAHTYQSLRTRTWFFIPLVIGSHFEWVGYIGRAINSQQTPYWALGPFILQSILLLVAPSLFAATIYMTLGRIVRLCNAEQHLLVPSTRLTKIFVIGDVLSFLVQSAGAGISGSGSLDSLHNGEKIIITGLFLQVLFFGLFVVTAFLFHSRMSKDGRRIAESSAIPWQKHMLALYAASTLILVRSLYRIIEYIQGNDGVIQRHEWFLYVLDGLLMFTVLVVFNIVHGSELNRLIKETSKAGRMEMDAISA